MTNPSGHAGEHLHARGHDHPGPHEHHVGATLWLTGLSGAGKTTIGDALVARLHHEGFDHFRLDGDALRDGLCADLGFSEADREENVRRIGEVALLFARRGHLSVVSAISPFRSGRDAVRFRHDTCGVPFIEVFVATPIEICEARDPKGLYRRARSGELANFTGVSGPYDPPDRPEIVLDAGANPVERCVATLHDWLVARGLLRSAEAVREDA